MSGFELIRTVLFPAGLGLLGFIEPCSIGASLLFIKYLEGKDATHQIVQVGVFAATRALFMGGLGILAAVLGMVFLEFQKGVWITFGIVYALIGVFYVTGRSGLLAVKLGPSLARLSGTSGPVALGLVFAFNIPACAGPLIFALLGTSAAGGAAGSALATGFASLVVFGMALSLPLIIAVLFRPARRTLDRLAGFSVHAPFWTGVILVALGLWSIWFGLFVTPQKAG
jgi:cytochrome c-type biogenesis protein